MPLRRGTTIVLEFVNHIRKNPSLIYRNAFIRYVFHKFTQTIGKCIPRQPETEFYCHIQDKSCIKSSNIPVRYINIPVHTSH